MKKRNKYKDLWVVADFETTTEKFYNENGYSKVWLWAISSSEGKTIAIGETIESFISYCTNNLNNYVIFFHNLKFDGSYILSYILNKRTPYKEQISARDNACFNALIGDMGQYYQITYHPRSEITYNFQDSLKLLPFKVEKIAKDFGLPILKLNIDYNDYTVNEKTIEYIKHDVEIVAMALSQIKALGMTEMTTASCAYTLYSKTNQFMYDYFPQLDEEYLEKYRLAYRGGRSQCNPLYQDKIIYNVKRYDINSMYPHIMRNLPLPIGNPIKQDKIGLREFELYEVDIKFKLKEGHLPTLLKKNVVFGDGSYYIETEGLERMCLSNIDYELLLRHYDIEIIQFLEIWGFKTMVGLFTNYIDYWYKVKQEHKGAWRIVAKLMLNSLYGKFGSRCKGKGKIPVLNEDGVLSHDLSEDKPMKKYYLPVAIAIVSHAHKLIDDAIIDTSIGNFVYCDTDSVHTLGEISNEMVDQVELGKFKLEGIELKSRYVRQKTYVYSELENDYLSYTITCAGMTDEIKNWCIDTYKDGIFDVFTEGFKVEDMKLMPTMVKGGIILTKTSFEIRVRGD